MYPDPVMQEVTHFCLPGLLPILKNTVQFVHEVQYCIYSVLHVHVYAYILHHVHVYTMCAYTYSALMVVSVFSTVSGVWVFRRVAEHKIPSLQLQAGVCGPGLQRHG